MSINNPTSLANVAFLNVTQSFSKAQSGVVTPFSGSMTGAFVPDFSLTNNWSSTLGSGINMAFPTNVTAGASGVFAFTQSSSGNCQVAWNSGYLSVGSVAALGVTANQITPVSYYAISTTRVVINALSLTS